MQLNTAQWLYLLAVALHIGFFGLFLRLLWWKRYADTHFWKRRPSLSREALRDRAVRAGRALPHLSLVVPARNEADVIERTVDHMATLNYPPHLYEVVVVTDEKEALVAARRREAAVAAVAATIGHRSAPPPLTTDAGTLLLALLAGLAVERATPLPASGPAAESGLDLGGPLGHLPLHRLRPLVAEAATELLTWRGGRSKERLLRRLRTGLPGQPEEAIAEAAAGLLALARPAAAAFMALGQPATTRPADPDTAALVDRLGALTGLSDRLQTAFHEIFPTTQDIMERKVAQYAQAADRPRVQHLVVPRDFDGELGGRCLGVEVPSTKGRALNWAMSFVEKRSTWCGFYDAESRPDGQVLLYIAHRVLQAGEVGRELPRIFQGPVFQVRNWYDMGPFCKIASLYQTLNHDWHLPVVFRRLPFVGGTNVFIERQLLAAIQGFDSSTLTEDLELGTRAWLAAGAWPEYLPYPSSEQTPPTLAGFYRQRLRWASGHIQVMNKIRQEQMGSPDRRRRLLRELWWKGQAQWIFFQGATLVPVLMAALWLMGLIDPRVLPVGWRYGLNAMSTIYLGFTIFAFFRYLKYLDPSSRPRRWLHQLVAVSQLLILPLAAFLFPVPYSSALVLHLLGRGPSHWVKTPRTKE